MDPSRLSVGIMLIDKTTSQAYFKNVGKAHFQTDSVFVLDFYCHWSSTNDKVLMLILDGFGNQLLVYYNGFKNLRAELLGYKFIKDKSLKKTFPLNEIDLNVKSFKCNPSLKYFSTLGCLLVSPSHLHLVGIRHS